VLMRKLATPTLITMLM